jgi:hypothetical protein
MHISLIVASLYAGWEPNICTRCVNARFLFVCLDPTVMISLRGMALPLQVYNSTCGKSLTIWAEAPGNTYDSIHCGALHSGDSLDGGVHNRGISCILGKEAR